MLSSVVDLALTVLLGASSWIWRDIVLRPTETPRTGVQSALDVAPVAGPDVVIVVIVAGIVLAIVLMVLRARRRRR